MNQLHLKEVGGIGAPAVNVQDFLNQHRFSRFQWLIFALCFLIVLLDGFDTAAIGFIAPSLLKEWGVTRQALAPVLGAALFGLCAGSIFAGPIADRIGRKLVLGCSVLLFGVACLWSAFAGNLTELTALRFVTGLGLGAAMPNAVTLMSEYCPDQRRSTLTNLMFCGFPLGAAFGGFLAAWMIPQWGWRSVLVLGGVTPVLLAVLILLLLPESVRYLVAKGKSAESIRAVLVRISASAPHAHAFVMTEKIKTGDSRSGVALILSRPFIVGSVMLWAAYFMGLVIFYSLINWMPLLLKDAGLSPRSATLVAALFPLGGVGAVAFGYLMDRFNANLVIATGYALTAVTIFLIGLVPGNIAILMTVVFLAGVLMNTAQSSMPALAAAFYPTQGRATGVAWMMGVGRLGGIVGSFLVAELTRRQFGFAGIFALVSVAGLVAMTALIVKHLASRQPA
jgi:AAHS family 4-hydroxybenzoate transporter-like MFS transporter